MIVRRPFLSHGLVLVGSLALAACGGDAGSPDAGPDAAVSSCVFQGLHWSHTAVGVQVGTTRDVSLELARDACADFTVRLESTGAGRIVGLPTEVTFVPNESARVPLEVTGEGEGSVTVRASLTDGQGMAWEAVLEVDVAPADLPACAGSGAGRVMPGAAAVEVPTGSSLSGARVAVAEGAARDDVYRVEPFDVAIGCSASQVPEGYLALGPAVSFTSPTGYRFQREIDLAIPLRTARLPSHAHRGHVEVAYTGPGIATPRVVSIANPDFQGRPGDGTLRFQAPRLGTYQAVVRADAPTTRERTFHHRGILGFSMGGSGSGRIGIGNPDRFDFVAPLGGPTDWTYMLEYIRRYHLGGFCTEAQRQDDLADGTLDTCGAASQEFAEARGELYEHVQHFENWWYEDAYDGQGGTFDREEYIAIFRDLAAMFGNLNTDGADDPAAPSVVPPGTPDSDRFRPNSQRCAAENQIRIAPQAEGDTDPATGWFDDEYNPRGTYAVISFCDGGQPRVDGRTDVGRWDPTASNGMPVEVAYAVDVNGNGTRDPGEPVIRNVHEPFEDVGADGLASAMEAGFDARTNPDPAGDDYDFQYNPTGTEQNWDRDEGESFDDVGIDGVLGTAQLDGGGYDRGEGDGTFTRTRGSARMIETSPRGYVRRYDDATIEGMDVFADGGVRDLFNWAVMGHHTMGAFAARGLPVRFYNGHAALHLDGRGSFTFTEVPYDEIGRYAMVRYGSIDASEAQKINGDGGHVGTVDQLTERVFSALAVMDRRWPGGDRRIVRDRLCPAISGACDHVNSISEEYVSERAGRTGPMSVVLPPGYFDPAYADYRYPVVYFLHGYGMEPMDLQALGLLLWNYMTAPTIPGSQRIQKMIFVFPDGRCRNQECLKGTFYTDAPESTPNGAAMETFLLDFMDHVDATYRTRGDETMRVVE